MSSGRTRSASSTASSGPSRARVEERLGRELPDVEPVARGVARIEFAEFWEEMTSVRRSAPAGAQW